MNKPEENRKKSLLDRMKELGQKYGVKVTDGSELGIGAIGIVGGVAGKQRKSQTPEPNNTKTAPILGE